MVFTLSIVKTLHYSPYPMGCVVCRHPNTSSFCDCLTPNFFTTVINLHMFRNLQDFATWLQEMLPVQPQDHLWDQSLIMFCQIRALFGRVSSATLNSESNVFFDHAFYSEALWCWNRKWTLTNCCHIVGGQCPSKISSFAVSSRFPMISHDSHLRVLLKPWNTAQVTEYT